MATSIQTLVAISVLSMFPWLLVKCVVTESQEEAHDNKFTIRL